MQRDIKGIKGNIIVLTFSLFMRQTVPFCNNWIGIHKAWFNSNNCIFFKRMLGSYMHTVANS